MSDPWMYLILTVLALAAIIYIARAIEDQMWR
jgi:hypothetical protein